MTQTANVDDLIVAAGEDGILSQASLDALNVRDIGQQIQNGLGVDIDDIEASEVVLVNFLIDDSGSIRFEGNSDIVREGHNMVLEAIDESKQQDNIIVYTGYLNGTILNTYIPLGSAERMSPQNFNPGGGTPLYKQGIVTLGTVVAKTQEFQDNGVPCRSITLIVTDGADNGGVASPECSKFKMILQDMLRQENHIVAAMGIDDGYTDFKQVFKEMGILDEWILTPKNDKHEIRQCFEMFSKSAVRASQSAGSFSEQQIGGFGG